MAATADPTSKPTAERSSASPLDAHQAPVADTRERSGKATAAMVLGIIGVLAAFLVAVVGLILGVIAIVFGRQAKADVASGRKSGHGQAQAGFVLGIVAVAASIISMIAAAAILAS
jgi:hypothetical protein